MAVHVWPHPASYVSLLNFPCTSSSTPHFIFRCGCTCGLNAAYRQAPPSRPVASGKEHSAFASLASICAAVFPFPSACAGPPWARMHACCAGAQPQHAVHKLKPHAACTLQHKQVFRRHRAAVNACSMLQCSVWHRAALCAHCPLHDPSMHARCRRMRLCSLPLAMPATACVTLRMPSTSRPACSSRMHAVCMAGGFGCMHTWLMGLPGPVGHHRACSWFCLLLGRRAAANRQRILTVPLSTGARC